MTNFNLTKRLLWGTLLGSLFGVLCFAGFSSNPSMPAEFIRWQTWSWSNLWMWSTIVNRALLGLMVAFSGFITIYPFLNFRIYAWMRGIKIGLLASLPMALGSLMGDNHDVAVGGFWIVIIAGMIIGMLIDIIITKIAGEGKELCEKNN